MSNHPEVWAGPVKIGEWDDHAVPPTYRRWDFDGNLVEERPYTDEEKREYEARMAQKEMDEAQKSLEEEIYNAVVDIIATRDLAISDQDTAMALENAAKNISAQLQTQYNQISSWTPASTYSRADMVAIRDQIKVLTERQKMVADALADFYAYRRVNDQAAVKIYNAVLWMARRISGRI